LSLYRVIDAITPADVDRSAPLGERSKVEFQLVAKVQERKPTSVTVVLRRDCERTEHR
jgi:hypothetical protein